MGIPRPLWTSVSVSITRERAVISWDCGEHGRRRHLKNTSVDWRLQRLLLKCQLDGKHLTKVCVCPPWELCPACLRRSPVNALASSSPWLPEHRAGPHRGRTGKSWSLAGLIPRCQGLDMAVEGSHSGWMESRLPRSSGMPPNDCFLTAYKPM